MGFKNWKTQDWRNDPLNLGKPRFVTWWHVFNVGLLTPLEVVARIQDQMEFVQSVFGPSEYDWIIGGVSVYRQPSSAWRCSDPATYRDDIARNRSPHQYVNIVVCQRGDKRLGQSVFPYDRDGVAIPERDSRHIINLDVEALPGGIYGSRSKGNTLPHLLGHFFGLPHVFQDDGRCPVIKNIDNDWDAGVTDTPTQQFPVGDEPIVEGTCSTNIRHCGSSLAIDLTNIMGSAWCASQFSPDQRTVMLTVIREYRPLLSSRQDCESKPCRTGFACDVNQRTLGWLSVIASPPVVQTAFVTLCKCVCISVSRAPNHIATQAENRVFL